MNPFVRAVRKADAGQQRYTPSAFAFGVIRKYVDDHGSVLTTNLAYSAFISLFPLLLVLVTVLGLAASIDGSFRADALNAVSGQVPLIGHQLELSKYQLRRNSVIGLVFGLLGLLWGATRLARAGLFTMAEVWNLPGPDRPGFGQRMARSGEFLVLLGLGVVVTTGLASLNTYGHHLFVLVVLAEVAAAVCNVGMYIGAFRVLTAKSIHVRRLIPGAVTAGLAWTVLQVLGTYLVHHFEHSDSVYGVFGTVLALIAWIYLAVEATVFSAEINVVLARRLWPRTILRPPLTEADRASMAMQALQNQRRPEQHVEVTFDDRPPGDTGSPSTPRTPEEIAPPAEAKVPPPD